MPSPYWPSPASAGERAEATYGDADAVIGPMGQVVGPAPKDRPF
jgi:hypothetical protein